MNNPFVILAAPDVSPEPDVQPAVCVIGQNTTDFSFEQLADSEIFQDELIQATHPRPVAWWLKEG